MVLDKAVAGCRTSVTRTLNEDRRYVGILNIQKRAGEYDKPSPGS
jgi:hypothetical protein